MHTNLASRSLFTIPTTIPISLLAGCALMEVVIARALPGVDPPARVARLSYLAGAVSFSPAGTDDWSALLNRPMTTGDTLWTDSDARAELHVGTAAVRLSSRTATELLNLDNRTLQMKLSQGTLGLRIRSRDEEDTLEVDTPTAAISALRTGVQPERPQEYRQVRPSTAVLGSPRMPKGEVRRDKSVSDQEKHRREIEQERTALVGKEKGRAKYQHI